ncbi:tRNA adenosine(34) deaminase TadA [Peptoniphilus sp. KCTC 25270]|nr:tRNA adenosine(34) deaminase TadA [Peptoniphilus sp. KCTC 25270]
MREALKEAQKAKDLGEVPIGAVIVQGEKIIGRGYNRREIDGDPVSHGEILAIQMAAKEMISWRLEECDLYVTIEPCPMCMGAILNSRINHLYIGAMNPRFGAAGSVVNLADYKAFNHSVEVESGILEEECSEMMQSFFRELRTKKEKKKTRGL